MLTEDVAVSLYNKLAPSFYLPPMEELSAMQCLDLMFAVTKRLVELEEKVLDLTIELNQVRSTYDPR